MKLYVFIYSFAGESVFSYKDLCSDMGVLLAQPDVLNGTILEYEKGYEFHSYRRHDVYRLVNEYPVSTIETHELSEYLEDMPEMNETNYRTIERADGRLTIVGLHTRKETV